MWLYVECHVPSFSTLENISKQNWKMDEGRPENDVKKLMTRRHLHKTKKVPTWLYYVPGVNLMTLVPKTGHEKRNLLSWWVSTQQALAMASLTLYPAPTLPPAGGFLTCLQGNVPSLISSPVWDPAPATSQHQAKAGQLFSRPLHH